MRSRETPAKALSALDVRDLLGLMAWQAAQEAMAGARPGEVYEAHFHAALRHSHLYQRDDQHVHTGFEARLGPAIRCVECLPALSVVNDRLQLITLAHI